MGRTETRLKRIEEAMAARVPDNWQERVNLAKYLTDLHIIYGSGSLEERKARPPVRPEDVNPEEEREKMRVALDEAYEAYGRRGDD